MAVALPTVVMHYNLFDMYTYSLFFSCRDQKENPPGLQGKLPQIISSQKCLICDTNQQADAENRAMYLESSSLANNAYYNKFGFEVKKDIFLGATTDSGAGEQPVRLSIMVREPQQSRSALGKTIPIKLGAGFKMMQ